MNKPYNSYNPRLFVLFYPQSQTMMGNPPQAIVTPHWNQTHIKPPKLLCKITGKGSRIKFFLRIPFEHQNIESQQENIARLTNNKYQHLHQKLLINP